MEVILLSDVEKVGLRGEVVDVARGYARNYLLPRKLAEPATPARVAEIDYKNVTQLRRYISEKGKIRSRRITGACRRHQVQVAQAVKRAREMALLPCVAEGVEPSEHRGGRGRREDRER